MKYWVFATFALLSSIFLNGNSQSVPKPRKHGYISLPGVSFGNQNNAATTTTTTTVAPVVRQLTPFDQVCLLSINSVRASHNAPPVTYNQTLADAATKCVEDRVRADSLVTPTCDCMGGVATIGTDYNTVPSQHCRVVVTDPQGPSWFSEYSNPAAGTPPIDWTNPSTSYPTHMNYFQMIYKPTTQVGCGYSRTTFTTAPNNDAYGTVCCWAPPLVPTSLTGNVEEDLQ